MKKISLLFVTLLVLVSGIVFSGCGNKYKKLNISLSGIYYSSDTYYAEDGVISLVLDDSSLSKCGLTFSLSGAKEWGAISVTANPAEVLKVEGYSIDGLNCNVAISALQPVEGGELIFTHLGSGKSCKVPLRIGMKLQKVNTNNNSYVLERPDFTQNDDDVTFEIPTNSLLVCNPINYTDVIVWVQKDIIPVPGVRVVSYDKEGKEIKDLDNIKNAVKSVISVSKACENDCTITLTPVSILDGVVTEYDKDVKVYVTKLLKRNDIATLSNTHGDNNNLLSKLALISNPDANAPRNSVLDGYDGYDLYSTAEVDLKITKPDNNNGYEYLDLNTNSYWDKIYNMTATSDIPGLTLEYLGFGKIRSIATATSVGDGNIKIQFTPKNCVGQINQFEIYIPCSVGERATSFSVINNGTPVAINKNEGVLSAVTPLNDSNSLGQAFNFEVLSTNTLSALNQYRITIHKDLLYINPEIIEIGQSDYFANDAEFKTQFDFTKEPVIKGNLYQISISKDGNDVKYYSVGNNFVSEPLSSYNTIYIKWVLNGDKKLQPGLDLAIDVSNMYDGSFNNIANNGFAETEISLSIEFDRQRTVGKINYGPTEAIYSPTGSNKWEMFGATSPDSDWKFYFDDSRIVDVTKQSQENPTKFYGFSIDEVFGLNNESLSAEEKLNINIKVSSNCQGLGFAVLDNNTHINENVPFEKVATFNYTEGKDNIILIGKLVYDIVPAEDVNEHNVTEFYVLKNKLYTQAIEYNKDTTYYKKINPGPIACGDYTIEFRQAGSDLKAEPLIKREVKVYRPLTDSDITVSIPLADFRGDVLETEGKEDVYVLATSKQYSVKIENTNTDFIGYAGLDIVHNVEGDLDINDIEKMTDVDEYGNQVLKTGKKGFFENGKENFAIFTYVIWVYKYDYYKQSSDKTPIAKEIAVYVYEPVTSALISSTNLDKYDYESLSHNTDLRETYASEVLTLSLNNDSETILNYADIEWSFIGVDAINESVRELPENKRAFTFAGPTGALGTPLIYNEKEDGTRTRAKNTGRIIATVNQYGISIPVYCSVNVYQPILSTSVELDTEVNLFKSGDPYVNLMVGGKKQFAATVKAKEGPATFNMVEYAICGESGIKSEDIATVSDEGELQVKNAGKVKLIIVSKDRVSSNWKSAEVNYLKYIQDNAIPNVIVDIIISDGTEKNPYLVASINDFKYIQKGLDKHYALVSNVNLNGNDITITGEFAGSLKSYRQYSTDETRFRISGIILDKDNSVLFSNLKGLIENVDFVVDFNYKETVNIDQAVGDSVLIGVIGINNGTLRDVTVISGGRIDTDTYGNHYTIGSLVAKNNSLVEITKQELVAVEANVKVTGNTSSTIILGGVIGENSGITGILKAKAPAVGTQINQGAEPDNAPGEADYSSIYYGKEGVTAYVKLRVTASSSDGALGGAVGYNNGGKVDHVLTDGEVFGTNDNQDLSMNNVGGIIGKNTQPRSANLGATIKIPSGAIISLGSATFNPQNFQITSSYSTAKVKGFNNVGGAVGHDVDGSYERVYYEMYTSGNGIEGKNNVGGVIGSATNTDLKYCYANNFGWGYKPASEVEEYDIIGNSYVGGLIGLANSTSDTPTTSGNYTDPYTTIISCAASININAGTKFAGLVGGLGKDSDGDENFIAIYTAYYYGLILNDSNHVIVNSNMETYNNAYWIINDIKTDDSYNGIGFDTLDGVNNNHPYVVDELGKNIISEVPTLITISEDALTYYYKQDNEGEYYFHDSQYLPYYGANLNIPAENRYTLVASVVETRDTTSTPSDYRAKALVLYYYGIINMADDLALDATYEFNKVSMHKIVEDQKIIVVPETLKRFTLRSSDPGIVRVLDGGYLLLQNEGQVVITMTSVVNPSISASFVVIVRTKVKTFSLHTSATLHEDFNVEKGNKILSIVKHSSKILYPNVESTIMYYKEFEYRPASHVGTKLIITCPTDSSVKVSDYISLNGTFVEETVDGLVYHIPFNTPITITVKEHSESQFKVVATPYLDLKYTDSNGRTTTLDPVDIKLRSIELYISTKMGVSAINANKHALTMMPSDSETNLNVKVSTDTKQNDMYINVEAIGTWEVDNPLWTEQSPSTVNPIIKVVDMLDIKLDGEKITKIPSGSSLNTYILDISGKDFNGKLQEFNLALKLNQNSHYISERLKLQITIYALGDDGQIVQHDGQKVQSVVFVDIEPQIVSSMIARNYRIIKQKSGSDDIKQSTIIRPGSTNIISIDISPNIAVYDYIEIVDKTTTERILFRQVYKDASGAYKIPENMDRWVDSGIKLKKLDDLGQNNMKVSQLFVEARLPLQAIANMPHEVGMTVYRGDQVIATSQLILEAVAYPTVIMTYTDPKGNETVADTSLATEITPDDTGKTVVKARADVNLAVGVEADIIVQTHNIDNGSLKYDIKITDYNENTDFTNIAIAGSDTLYSKLLTVEYIYGKYILIFTNDTKSQWGNMIGKKIHLAFSASKTVNGATEYCESTIVFTVREFVIHGISMTRANSRGDLYGDWGEEFNTEFYFDKTDISYYNDGYWNVKYTMLSSVQLNTIVDEGLRTDFTKINAILEELNSGWTGNKEFRLRNNKYADPIGTTIIDDYSAPQGGFKIKNRDSKFKILANNPSGTSYENINDYSLEVRFKLGYDTENYPILTSLEADTKLETNRFGFSLDIKRTPFDDYIIIKTQEEFEDMLEGKYYKLGDNIELENYTPMDVAIGGLAGGEYTITIKTFNEPQLKTNYLTGDINIGLFGTLAENSVIQNLKVNYSPMLINLNAEYEEHPGNEVFFGGIAGKNLGVITNVNVFGSVKIVANNIAAQLISCGGITATNGDLESEKIATITKSSVTLSIEAIAAIGGIAESNYGKIVNTNFGGKIISNSDLPNLASEVLTAGFVVNNTANAYISLSYVEFTSDDYSLLSVGKTAGFVLNNDGTINNCYISKAKIFTQGNIGGFVYSNSGVINNTYSYVETENSLFYSKFIYDTTDTGEITNCYCIAEPDDTNSEVEGLYIVRPIDINTIEWKGFIFAKTEGEGLWSKSPEGPKLPNAKFNPNYEKYEDIYNIYDVETYEGWLDMFRSKDNIIENIEIQIVRDIDFSAEGFVGNPVSANQILMSNIEGNDMEIRNFTIYKVDEGSVGVNNYIGLFKEIVGATITNLTITPAEIKASGTYAVGSLAGVMDSVRLYNINIDNDKLLVLGRNAVGGLAGVIHGSFEIIGINTKASALAVYKHGVNGQYNMYLDKSVTGVNGVGNISNVSYAGSIAGIIDGYGLTSQIAQPWRDINEYYVVRNVNINKSVVIGAETVGALFGFVGEFTLITDSHYVVPADASYQGACVSGGLVGENRGIIQNCSIIAEVNNGERASLIQVFDNFSKINGGIVGYNIGGLVDNCIVDIDVCTNVQFATVGAVIGRNVAGSVFNTTIAGGVVKGYIAGGLVGSDYTYATVHRSVIGDATVTADTVKAFDTLKTIRFVKYYSDEDNNKPFRNIVFSDIFMETFIKAKTYNYNREYQGPSSTTKMITASSIYGLVIGYSENEYLSGHFVLDTTVDPEYDLYEYDPVNKEYKKSSAQSVVNKYKYIDECQYSDEQLTISLTVNCDIEKSMYEVIPGNEEIIVPCIKELESTPYAQYFVTEGENAAKILYLVAYDNASGYESWSSASGYTDKLVVIK